MRLKIDSIIFGFIGNIWLAVVTVLPQKPNILKRAEDYVGYEEDHQSSANFRY